MEVLHQAEEIINQRYRILHKLGQGGVGITYAAVDLETGEQVALKVLSLHRMSDWKKMELFEREAQILSQLNHPAIPRYLDYFQIDTNSNRSFYIVQQLAPGNSLATLVENGWLPGEGEIRQIASQILGILTYLHSLTPPVIHRDIKPQNIILCDHQKKLFLVDFGAVADTYHNTVTGGSTVVGTFGYMAPEQFRGQAFASTDLYGLGTTLLFLLTGKSPTDLPQRQLKIDFRPYVNTSQDLETWLEQMLEPVSADRFSSAEVALATLLGQRELIPRLSKKSHLIVTGTKNNLIVKIPPGCFYNNYNFISLFFSIVFIGVLGLIYWIILVDYFGGLGLAALILLFIFSLPVIMFVACIPILRNYVVKSLKSLCKTLFSKPWSLVITFFLNSASSILLQIDQDYISLERWLLGWCIQRIKIPNSDIISVGLKNPMRYKFSNILIFYSCKPFWDSEYPKKIEKYFRFGAFLTQQEKDWLVWQIRQYCSVNNTFAKKRV
ncbi:protein kinase family protein [Cylindrospermum stagnale PCC 7417]|uniref:non-specific serine/threonine protein kinase n=1 Tax=Cylindrospermum stagnale PCC 7417 TaxID=56107 RepID=K9X1Y6_9NOST|nr:serine/threonine-protein kinase [Cylindrospermum stagnale]AFZ26488.1 protein kinase family protein [Cylindrospermum stagnale PCC 7417]